MKLTGQPQLQVVGRNIKLKNPLRVSTTSVHVEDPPGRTSEIAAIFSVQDRICRVERMH